MKDWQKVPMSEELDSAFRDCMYALRDKALAEGELDETFIQPLGIIIDYYEALLDNWNATIEGYRAAIDRAVIGASGSAGPGYCDECGAPVLFFTELPRLCDTHRNALDVVYFACEPILDDDLPKQVRIGHTTQRLEDRLRDEGGLVALRTEPGGVRRETELHGRFAHLRCGLSRYRLEGELLEYLADDLAFLVREREAA